MSSIQPAYPEISLPLIHRGKVRDMYDAGNGHLLLVASDRLSAFDVILPDLIPGKGEVLTQLSNYWFQQTRSIIPNHLSDIALDQFIQDKTLLDKLRYRAIVVRKLKRLPVEAVVRGYIIGSGWKDYKQTGSLCGIALPPGLKLAEQLPQPIFTPSTKAEVGDHDENISFKQLCASIGEPLATQVRDCSLSLYQFAAQQAFTKGIIIADTKFEFGIDDEGQLTLIDEVLTPDSSRFWPADEYEEGISPPSYDKQFVRDYLESIDWDKRAPGPHLPTPVIQASFQRYLNAYEQLTGKHWPPKQ